MAERAHPAGPQLLVVNEERELASALTAAGVPTGRPVVVLIGGAAKLPEDATGTVEELVRDGIVATAQSAGAVIITGGTDAGVMSLAGQARRRLKAKVPLIGVAPIRRVKADDIEGATGDTPLEPNHTHQILAPGDDWGTELPWMLEAARVTSAGKAIVAVLVDGGPLALTEATKCLAQGWQLITIAGSGRAANDLAAIGRGDNSAALGGARTSAIHVADVAGGPTALAAMLRRLLERRPSAPRSTDGGRVKIDYPALYTAASEASKRGQRLHKWLVLFELLFAIIGLAVASAIGVLTLAGVLALEPELPEGIPPPPFSGNPTESVVAFALAGFFLAAFVVKFVGRSAKYDEDWFVGRAVAETTKSDAWRYMMRVPPYDGDEADNVFSVEISRLARQASVIRQAIDRLPAQPQQISDTMRGVAGLDLPERRRFYVRYRLRDQANWYGRRAARHRRRASGWFWLTVMFQLLAVGLAVLTLWYTNLPTGDKEIAALLLRLMSLFASTAIFFTAWSQVNRDDELAKSYSSALQELLLIADMADPEPSDASLAALVDKGEDAIGRENRVWVAKRTDREESPEFGHAE